jgi:two-component system chemotaxis response regulator CheB
MNKNSRLSQVEAIVIGASAGGIVALLEIFPHLPADFHIPIIFVLHLPASVPSLLADVFEKKIKLKIKEADEKEPIFPGTIYYAPAGYHLLIEADKTFSLSTEDPVCFSRPSIDVLFESAASSYKNKLVGILLTGANTDGSLGLKRIKELGGLTIIQDPNEAAISLMPESARPYVRPENILTLKKITSFLLDIDKAEKK